MAHIKRISFESVGKAEGCTCDRCGQYIRNIWTVEYKEGLTMHYGLDCWQKVCRQGLNQHGMKLMKKAMKAIQNYEERLAKYTSGEMTVETDQGWLADQEDKMSAWYGHTFEEYRAWMINEFFPYRIAEAQKELAKFGKINFEA